jgi:hypothetical protein
LLAYSTSYLAGNKQLAVAICCIYNKVLLERPRTKERLQFNLLRKRAFVTFLRNYVLSLAMLLQLINANYNKVTAILFTLKAIKRHSKLFN